jgi:TonB family protein
MRPLAVLPFAVALIVLPALAAEQLAVVQAVAPEYPDTACQALVEGRVAVEVTVLPGGGLGETRTKGIPLLQAAAMPAALSWRFSPVAEPTPITLTFVFSIARQPDGFQAPTTVFFRPPYEVEVRCRPAKVAPRVGSGARSNNKMQRTSPG